MKDKWIPNYTTNRVLHPPEEEEWEWRVCELIDWSKKAWDCQLIDSRFHKKDAEAIKQIPLSGRNTPNTIFWLYTGKAEYMVKSRYHVARNLKQREDMRGVSSQIGVHSMVWTKIWHSHIPNKIKVFGWRRVMKSCLLERIWFDDKFWTMILVSYAREQKKQKFMHFGNAV